MTAFDIEEILERETRRAQALNAGSMHVPAFLRSEKGPLPGAVSELDAPLLLWPSQRHLMPRRCPNEDCGVGSANFDTDPPYGRSRHGATTCMLCSRTVVRWKDDRTRPVPLTDDDLMPRRGRPPGVKGGRWSKDHDACIDCGTTSKPHNSAGRCTGCRSTYYRKRAVAQ